MNQIAAVLAPTALPNVAGALVHAEAATAQGSNFADLLAQFRTALVNHLAGGEAPPDAIASAASQTAATAGEPALPPDVVQAAPPSTALSPLDILALPPSRPRTDPDAISEGGAATIPPHLALLQLVFPAAHAQPLPGEASATPQTPAGGVDALGLRGAIRPEQTIAGSHLSTGKPQAQAAPPAAPQSPPSASVLAVAQPAPSATDYKASETAVEHASAPIALLTALPKLKLSDAPQAPNGPKLKPAEATPARHAATTASPALRHADTPTDVIAQAKTTPSAYPAIDAVGSQSHTAALSVFAPASSFAQLAQIDHAQVGAPAQPPAMVVAPAPVLPTLIDTRVVTTTAMASPQAGVTLDALAVHVARKSQEGSSQFEIRLHPMELGRLDISLTIAEDGRVQAVLRVERPETLDMLQRDARALEQQLRQAGLEVGANALSFSLSHGNGQRQAPFTGWPAFADAQSAADAAKDEAAPTYLAVRTRDGIDIRV